MQNKIFDNISYFAEWYGLNLHDAKFENTVSLYSQSSSLVSFQNVTEDIKIVRAPMGSGKTSALINWLKTQPAHFSVLAISCRKTFAVELLNKFQANNLHGFDLYSDVISREITSDKLIIQVESLYRVTKNYHVLILDEIMSIFTQFFSRTMNKLYEVDTKFLQLLKTAKMIIIMDATLNKYVIDFISRCRPFSPIGLIVNSFVGQDFNKRTAFFCPVFTNTDSKGFLDILNLKLMSNKKVCIFCSTVTAVEYMREKILENHKKRILVLTAQHGRCSSISTWNEYDIVIYNSVVTVGLSFELEYFDCLFVYIQIFNKGPDMVSIYQSIGRVRKIIDNEMYIYINPSFIKHKDPLSPIIFPVCHNWSINDYMILQTSVLDFTSKCEFVYASKSLIRTFFRPRHVIERTALNSLCDSVQLLCILLKNNKIKIVINDDLYPVSKEVLFKFLETSVTECSHIIRKSVKSKTLDVKHLLMSKDTIMNGDLYINGNLEIHKNYLFYLDKFHKKFLKKDVDLGHTADIIQNLLSEQNRYFFINIFLAKCVLDDLSKEKIKTIYEEIQYYDLPMDFLCRNKLILCDVANTFEWNMLLDVAVIGASITKFLRLSSCTDTTIDIAEDTVILCAAKYSSKIINVLQLIFTTHVQFFERYNVKTLKLYYKLKGFTIVTNHYSIADFSILLIKLFMKLAYNMDLLRSRPRYINNRPFRSLSKSELEKLLDDWNIPRQNLTTCKSLRKALSEAAKQKHCVYKLRGSDVSTVLSVQT